MSVQRPERIYNETTTTHTTTKRFNYGKPSGWDKQSKPKSKEYKVTWWQILKGGLFDEEMEPKDYRKYSDFMLELKIASLTLLTITIISWIVINSPFIKDSAMNDVNNNPTWMDKGLDYIMGKEDYNIKPLAPVADTIVIVPIVTQQEVDSIMSKYKQDSTHLADSLLSLE